MKRARKGGLALKRCMVGLTSRKCNKIFFMSLSHFLTNAVKREQDRRIMEVREAETYLVGRGRKDVRYNDSKV